MEINSNNNSIRHAHTQLRLKAHQARLANKKELNESLKSLNDSSKSISNDEAFKYLQSRSNIYSSSKSSNSYSDNYYHISSLSKQLKTVNESIAKYSTSNSSEDKAEATKKSELEIGNLEIKLQETAYNQNTYTRSYTSKDETVNLGSYQLRDLDLQVKLDEDNQRYSEGQAKIDLSSQEFELSLAQTFEGENVFLFDEEAKIEINSNVYLDKLILSDDNLHYTAHSSSGEIESNDDHIMEALRSLESYDSIFSKGTSDNLATTAKTNKTTILEEFQNFTKSHEDTESLKRDLLQLRINSIQSQDRSTQGITGILLDIL